MRNEELYIQKSIALDTTLAFQALVNCVTTAYQILNQSKSEEWVPLDSNYYLQQHHTLLTSCQNNNFPCGMLVLA